MVDIATRYTDLKNTCATMGANTSKTDTDLALFSGELETSSSSVQPNVQPRSSPGFPTNLSAPQGTAIPSQNPSPQPSSNFSITTQFRTAPTIPRARSVQTSLASPPQTSARAAFSPSLESPSAPETFSHPHRLPPVESRETVRAQAAGVTTWRIVDSSDEIYESLQIGRVAPSQDFAGSLAGVANQREPVGVDTKPSILQLSTPSVIDLLPSTTPSELNVRARTPTPEPSPSATSGTLDDIFPSSPAHYPDELEILSGIGRGPSTVASVLRSRKRSLSTAAAPPPKKKRQLILVSHAAEIADRAFEPWYQENLKNKQGDIRDESDVAAKSDFGFFNPFPDGFPLTDEEELLLLDRHPGSCLYQDSDHEDEEVWSRVVNDPDCVQGETKEERVERQMRLLARPRNVDRTTQKSYLQPGDNPPLPLNEEQLLLKQARECMLQEQEAGARRSRMLREKALRRRGLIDSPSSDSSLTEGHTFSETHKVSSISDLFSGKGDEVPQLKEVEPALPQSATKYATPKFAPMTSERDEF